ncbi:acyl-ACP--UDP-N-acetylglucosamine O-acyltransferase [Thiohalophilus sp.]|uniref:acyl-ACP--UDP-N-acetylglucosamine O-acyltransferase n=1 Tax=Thiohalophilus sp. TaxID=3028392 RepID=UPI002ACE3036|nr:acyl-ACP--UDP-N-acetylglucosamine O-acyltransferase [Thiohalophilus sp.]MDZ7805142.1 acyl-ACP--UDP-N-acetylglucosamine O-acyltransferase [Thiohalophilus sp.]
MSIDQRAIIDPGARIADDVSIGAFSIIGQDVEIGAGTIIGPHVIINGPTRIGCNNHFFQFSSIGEIPQDKKYHGENSRLEIGDGNTIREFVTINRGTDDGGGVTRIGNDNWLMAYIHIAHDCLVGNNTIFANGASLAGHVEIDDYVILGGFTLIHQFTKIGNHAFCGMGSAISKDIPPYVMVSGNPASPYGINSEGLKRREYSKEAIKAIKNAYKIIYRSGHTSDEARQYLKPLAEQHPEVQPMLDFLNRSQRGILR